MRVQRDVAHHDHLVVVGLERDREVLRRVLVQPGEDLLVHVGDARRACARARRGRGPRRSPRGSRAPRARSGPCRSVAVGLPHRCEVWRRSRGASGVGWSVGLRGGGRVLRLGAGAAPSGRRSHAVRRRGVPHRTSAKISCTRSASSVSCSISSSARRSRISRLSTRAPARAAECACVDQQAHLGVDASPRPRRSSRACW